MEVMRFRAIYGEQSCINKPRTYLLFLNFVGGRLVGDDGEESGGGGCGRKTADDDSFLVQFGEELQ